VKKDRLKQAELPITFRSDASFSCKGGDHGSSASLRIADGAGFEVKCLRGNLWITQHGDLEDRIIGRGESFVLDRPGLSLVTALGDPALLVVRPGMVIARRPLRHAA
jgi:Protein of unknown function (DUF2917)